MRTAAEIGDAVFADISELESDAQLTALIRQYGAEGTAFNNILYSVPSKTRSYQLNSSSEYRSGDGANQAPFFLDLPRPSVSLQPSHAPALSVVP